MVLEVKGDFMEARSELEEALDKYLKSLGLDGDFDENFRDTPLRWIKYLEEFCEPYDPSVDLGKSFPAPVENAYDHAMVIQTNIPYQAVCAHHLVPVLGYCHLGYIPSSRVVGLSKLTRLVHGITHMKPSLQEDVGNKIADALMTYLQAIGSIVVITAEHGCMACRGVAQLGIFTTTASLRGVFRGNDKARAEFYNVANLRGIRHG